MKYDPIQETLVLQSIKLLGYGTLVEIRERWTKPPFDELEEKVKELSESLLRKLIKRWEKKHVITSEVQDGERNYFIQTGIPYLPKLDKIHLVGLADKDAKKFLKELEDSAKKITAYASKEPVYCKFVDVELTFENIDPLLGGDLGKVERELVFPRDYNGDYYIRQNWLFAYIRDNARRLNISRLAPYIQPSKGIFIEPPETFRTNQIRVVKGHVTYEAIPPGCKFKSVWHFPLKGYDGFDTLDKWIEGFRKFETHPQHGLGSNFKVFGGRIKLLDFKEIE